MVEHHVHDDGDTAFVALIDERLELLGRTVGLIHSEVVVRRIAPVVVAVKLAHWHQFQGIDAQVLDIIQAFHQAGKTAFGRIVKGPQLVDNQVVLVRALEVQGLLRPVESRLGCLQNRHIPSVRSAHRIRWQLIAPYRCRFIRIVRMQLQLGKCLRKLLLHAV